MTNDHEAYVVALRHSDCGMFQSRVEDAIFVMATNDEKSDVTSTFTASWSPYSLTRRRMLKDACVSILSNTGIVI